VPAGDFAVGLIESISAHSQMKVEKRAIGGVPWQPWTNPFMRFDVGGPIHPTRQIFGLDKALGLPALYAATKILADNTASLPIKVYTTARDGRRVPYTGPTLFDNPSVIDTPYEWMFACMSSLLLQGNVWGLITGRDGFGFPTGIEWVPAERVQVEQENPEVFNPLAANVYVDGRRMKWYGADSELFHLRGYNYPGRIEGISPMMKFAHIVLSGHEMQRYSNDWFAAGGFPPGTFQNSELEIDAEQAAQIRRMVTTSIQRHEPLVYGRDWDYTPITVPPNEAVFIQAMQLNAAQVAAIYDMPANRVGGSNGSSLTYSTVEQNDIQVIGAMRPWNQRLISGFGRILPARRNIDFDTNFLLKTDLKTQAEIDQIDRNIGTRTVDEIRESHGYAPYPNGAGQESLPLQLIVSMGQRAGALPKSLMPQIDLLIDIAGAKLEKLQKQGATKTPAGSEFAPDPKTGKPAGPANDPGQFYANMMNAYSRMAEESSLTELAAFLRDPQIQRSVINQIELEAAAPLMKNAALNDIIENYKELPPGGING
jgi:HK97 family phage portal protein